MLTYEHRSAAGVFALISPWNMPLYLLTWKVAPCLAFGCTAVAKPSEVTSATAFLLADAIHASGVLAVVSCGLFMSQVTPRITGAATRQIVIPFWALATTVLSSSLFVLIGVSAQSAFQLLQGVETLPQRMEEHVANARAVAQWLERDDRVSWVSWAGLPSHPHHARAQRYLPKGPGSVFSFGVVGGRAAGRRLIESVQLASHLANIGDTRTLVIHPGSTTHQQLSADQLVAAGVPEDLVRISVGLEDLEDILWDLDQALDTALKASDEEFEDLPQVPAENAEENDDAPDTTRAVGVGA